MKDECKKRTIRVQEEYNWCKISARAARVERNMSVMEVLDEYK